jgi:hypothetical protein
MTPEDLLARQAQFWSVYIKRAFTHGKLQHYFHAFLPGQPVYAMDRYFCRLVDEARLTIPDDEVFRPATLLTPAGWIFLEEPAPLPEPGQRLQTVGWCPVKPGPLGLGGVQCAGLTAHATGGLGQPDTTWGLEPDVTLRQHMARMEQGPTALQHPERASTAGDPRHVVRWFYTALNLMANKLTLVAAAPFARAVRRRAAGEGVALPDAFRRITLRRVEAARLAAGAAGQARDWNCQWQVRGHWRHYQDGKVVYVDSYIKGPVGKPLKPIQTPFFRVER